MTLYIVTVSVAMDDDIYRDVVEMTREQATELRQRGVASVAQQGLLTELSVEPLTIIAHTDWMKEYGNLLTDEDEDLVEKFGASREVATALASDLREADRGA